MILYNRSGTQTGETFDLDNTLTQQGEAADSKKTGDAIKECYDSLDPEIWLTREPYGYLSEYGLVPGDINQSTGEIKPSTTYNVTDYIPVVDGTTYIIRKTALLCYYDSNKGYLGIKQYGETWECPSTAAFVRITVSNTYKDAARFLPFELFGKTNINGKIYTGITENADIVIEEGLNDFAAGSGMHFQKTDNQFNYYNDWVQFTQIGKGIQSSDGSFAYNDSIDQSNEFDSTKQVTPVKYFEVDEGQTLTANKPWNNGAYYDENHEYIGSIGVQNGTHPSFFAPEGCKYVRLNFKPMATIESLKGLTVIAVNNSAPNRRMPIIKNPVPMYQINGDMISKNYLDKVVPSMMESEYLSAMKCLAIREANGREHSIRIGNFNIYVGNLSKGWDLIRKMLMDYGVDICGFQEVYQVNGGDDLASFLKSWQFPYGFFTNLTDGEDPIDKSIVSRHEILSCTKLEFETTSSNARYLNCKIQLPRLLDVYNPKRVLSVYVVHFAITDATGKAAIANELLNVISNDTSEYIVIAGDMNDMGSTEENKTYWRTLEAGGFRPVLPITSKTITDDENEVSTEADWRKMSLDQFCISSNIEAVRYGIVNTKDGYGDSTVQVINGEPCLSDHDFVWADIIFKDEVRTVPNN